MHLELILGGAAILFVAWLHRRAVKAVRASEGFAPDFQGPHTRR